MTDAYTNVSMMATYKLPTQLNLEAFTRANNLLDEEIREHASFLKDIAPMGGRSIMFGLRGEFQQTKFGAQVKEFAWVGVGL